MSWRGAQHEFTESVILPHDITMRYLALSKAGLIGKLWVERGQYWLAPLDACHAYNAREHINRADLTALILRTEAAASCPRKPVAAELAPVRIACAA